VGPLRPYLRRGAAALVTGPLGHLVAGVVDIVAVVLAALRDRSRR
jgi:hypothetical protein